MRAPKRPSLGAGYRVEDIQYVDDGLDPSQVEAICEIRFAIQRAAYGQLEQSRENIVDDLLNQYALRDSAYLVWAGDRAVAYGLIALDRVAEEYILGNYVHPSQPSRRELLVELFTHSISSIRADCAGGADWKILASAWAGDVDVLGVLAALGLHHERSFYRMEIDSDNPAIPVVNPALPPGVVIEELATDEQRRVWHDVDQIAFAQHWGYVPRPYEEAWEYLSRVASAAPRDWWLVRVDGVPAGVGLLSDKRRELSQGYVDVLGVHPDFRGRGLAKLMLQRAFVRYRDEGLDGTALHVDATNTTGALAVYEAVGMHIVRETTCMKLALESTSE